MLPLSRLNVLELQEFKERLRSALRWAGQGHRPCGACPAADFVKQLAFGTSVAIVLETELALRCQLPAISGHRAISGFHLISLTHLTSSTGIKPFTDRLCCCSRAPCQHHWHSGSVPRRRWLRDQSRSRRSSWERALCRNLIFIIRPSRSICRHAQGAGFKCGLLVSSQPISLTTINARLNVTDANIPSRWLLSSNRSLVFAGRESRGGWDGSCNRFRTSYRAFRCRRATSLLRMRNGDVAGWDRVRAPRLRTTHFRAPNVQTFWNRSRENRVGLLSWRRWVPEGFPTEKTSHHHVR